MRFAQIPGQDQLKEQLLRSVQEGRVPHSTLFLGKEGCGSLAMTLAWITYMECSNKKPLDSCGSCGPCKKMDALAHPDLHFSYPFISTAGPGSGTSAAFMESFRHMVLKNPMAGIQDWIAQLDSANKQLNIPAAECRDLIQRLSYTSYQGGYKYLVLWRPEYLEKEGNILLKLIEEPSLKTLLFFVSPQEHEILPTLLSRMQRIRVMPYTRNQVLEVIRNEYPKSHREAEMAAFRAQGDLQLARELMEGQAMEWHKAWLEFWGHCLKRQVPALIQWSEKSASAGRENLKLILESGQHHMRELLLEPEQNPVKGPEGTAFVEDIYGVLEQCFGYLEHNANPRIAFTSLGLQIMQMLRNQRRPLSKKATVWDA